MAEPHETAEENRKTELDGEVPEAGFTARMYRKNPRRMQIYQALDLPYREVPLDEAVGKMAADYVYLVSARNPAHRAGRSYHGRVYPAHQRVPGEKTERGRAGKSCPRSDKDCIFLKTILY